MHFTKHSASAPQRCFNGGYLFLQQVYYELGLDRICAMIRTRHGFSYNLNSILSRLVYTRILYPASKLSSYKDSGRFIEQPDFELHQIYRALSVLAEESDYIQARLFRNNSSVFLLTNFHPSDTIICKRDGFSPYSFYSSGLLVSFFIARISYRYFLPSFA